ncbi:hypothetical protein ABZ725_14710 [Streptomyces sp. NPDC006872]|uniref:hypothetical protein n=1 Tax=Streptomyces sp. NPDC006872 TaxID=3155720 RepID=UPI0033FF2EAA
MDITTEPRAAGLYVIQQTGMQQWAEDHGTWQAHGVRLDLMDGPARLAVCKLEVPQSRAEARAQAVAEEIEPWGLTLRALAAVAEARAWQARLVPLIVAADEAERNMWPLEDYARDELVSYATPAEIEKAKSSDAYEWAGMPLARLIAARWRDELTARQRRLLATAPDVTVHPIHPAWEQPPLFGVTGVSTAQVVARELLAGWAAVRDLRDPLITWAVRDAGVTRTQVQQTTGVSRSTINRLLPG